MLQSKQASTLRQCLWLPALQAEQAERVAIFAEEEAERERHRQAFNDMVAIARAAAAENPPPPFDPMRFRALPPGKLGKVTCTFAV